MEAGGKDLFWYFKFCVPAVYRAVLLSYCRVADPHHLNADRIRVPLFLLIQIRIRLLTWMRTGSRSCSSSKWCKSATLGLQRTFTWHHFSLHASALSVLGPPRLHFEPLKLLNLDFNADPDPAFNCKAEPDPASQNNANPCLFGSATMLYCLILNPRKYKKYLFKLLWFFILGKYG